MTAQEKAEIKEMFQDLINVANTKHDAQYELINYKLDQIQTQTTKTNGRVNRLEEKELTHFTTCPQIKKIRVLEDTALSNKTIKTWIISSITVTSIIFSVILAAFKMFS